MSELKEGDEVTFDYFGNQHTGRIGPKVDWVHRWLYCDKKLDCTWRSSVVGDWYKRIYKLSEPNDCEPDDESQFSDMKLKPSQTGESISFTTYPPLTQTNNNKEKQTMSINKTIAKMYPKTDDAVIVDRQFYNEFRSDNGVLWGMLFNTPANRKALLAKAKELEAKDEVEK